MSNTAQGQQHFGIKKVPCFCLHLPKRFLYFFVQLQPAVFAYMVKLLYILSKKTEENKLKKKTKPFDTTKSARISFFALFMDEVQSIVWIRYGLSTCILTITDWLFLPSIASMHIVCLYFLIRNIQLQLKAICFSCSSCMTMICKRSEKY